MTDIKDVYEVYKRHLYLEDTHLIDVALATYVTKDLPGKPLWIIPVGPSSYGKSTLASFLPFLEKQQENDSKYRILSMDQMTSKAFASGVKRNENQDYGEWLQNQNSVIYFSDMASLLVSQESRQVFAMFRSLYDGDIILDTGTRKLQYESCHVNLLGFSTPKIRSDIEHMSAMGSRELVYDLPTIKEPEKMNTKEVTSEGLREIKEIVKKFIDGLNEKPKEPNDETQKFLGEVANTICVLRAEPSTTQEGLLVEPIEPEIPKRLYDQLIKLWRGMDTIGIPDEKTEEQKTSKTSVIKDIQNGSGSRLRRMVIGVFFEKEQELIEWSKQTSSGYLPPQYSPRLTIRQVSNRLVISLKEITKEFMVMSSLGFLEPIEKIPVPEIWYNEETEKNEEKVVENNWSCYDKNTEWAWIKTPLRTGPIFKKYDEHFKLF